MEERGFGSLFAHSYFEVGPVGAVVALLANGERAHEVKDFFGPRRSLGRQGGECAQGVVGQALGFAVAIDGDVH